MPPLPSKVLYRIQHTLGVKTTYDPSSIPQNALWEARNVRSDEAGLLRIRGGIGPHGPSLGNGKIQALYEAFDHMMLVWQRNLYFADHSQNKTLVLPNAIGTTSTDLVKIVRWTRSGAEMCYLFGGNGVYQTNKITGQLVTPYTPATGEQLNLIRNTDGTQNLNSGPAKCKYAVVRASISQRMAAAGNPTSPNTVYLTAPLDATFWPANQTVQLPDDGAVITGLANWNNALVIFRDKDVWAFFGSDVTDTAARLVLQDSSVGCQVERSIADVPGIGLTFLGPDNVYALQELLGVENRVKAVPIGDDVRKFLLKAIADGYDGVNAIYFNREYRICFPNAIEPERVFRLSLQHESTWYVDSGPVTVQYCVHNKSLFAASKDTGFLQKFDDTLKSDNGEIIHFSITFRREDLGAGMARVRRVFLYLIGTKTIQNLALSVACDGGVIETKELSVDAAAIPDFIIGQSAIGMAGIGRMQPVQVYEAHFSPSLKGQFAQVKISAAELNEEVAVLGYGIEYQPAPRAKGDRQGVTVK